MTDPKVWIRKRACKSGKTTYHLRWLCPTSATWKSRKVGTDKRQADREAALLESKLREGTYRALSRTAWSAFVDDHVDKLIGKRNAIEARKALDEFGEVCSPVGPHAVTFGMVEKYVTYLRSPDEENERPERNALATRNKKLRYLRAAFRMAVRRGVAAANPMDGWKFEREDRRQIRTATNGEEGAILTAAKDLYGQRWEAFVTAALYTGGRRGELLSLRWEHVDLDGASVTFTHTKGKRDRIVPLNPETVAILRRVQAQTLQAGGPFVGMLHNINRKWSRICGKAEVEALTIHDLRRTYVTRLVRSGAPPDVVMALAGHSSLATTMQFYTSTTEADKRAAVAKLRQVAS